MATPPTTTDLPPTQAERAIRRRIARHGPITFADFMAAALYAPGGYYTRSTAGDDYYTSPRIHPAFGALLAIHLFHLWNLLQRPNPFTVVEPGAGDGLLCRDILTAARHLPDGFADAIRYTIIDPLPAPGHENSFPNATRLAADALSADALSINPSSIDPLPGAGHEKSFPNATRLAADALSADALSINPSSLPSPAHCILSNELLDALPVHRVRMAGGDLRELYVGVESDVADGYEGALIESPGEPSTPALATRLSDLGITLADGQTAEICLLLNAWAGATAALLDTGFALTIDYGRAAADIYDPTARPHGTLVTYRNHRQTDAPLHDVGRQDITAQVDFSSAQRSAEAAGLTTVGNIPQGAFLQRLGLQTIRRSAPPLDADGSGWLIIPAGPDGLPPAALPDAFGAPPDDSRAWLTNLTHLAQPGGLGDFRVLLQSKGLPSERAAAALSWLDGEPAQHGYTPSSLAAMIPPESLALGPEHIRLTQ